MLNRNGERTDRAVVVVRDRVGTKAGMIRCLRKLPRFENSRSVEMSSHARDYRQRRRFNSSGRAPDWIVVDAGRCSSLAGVEVYPAATLIAHRVRSTGYKKREQIEERREILSALRTKLTIGGAVADLATSADLVDAAVCILAGDDFISGRAIKRGSAWQKAVDWVGWDCFWSGRCDSSTQLEPRRTIL